MTPYVNQSDNVPKLRAIGQSGVQASAIGLGTWAMGGTF